jgi:UDP-N-acetylmuramate--alanine ligase
MDYYGTLPQLKKAFFDFAMRVPFYGLAIVCGDDAEVRDTFRDYGKRILYYGFGAENDLRIAGGQGHYEVFFNEKKLGEFKLHLPGRHNALNAAAAIAAGLEAGFPFSVCAAGIEAFQGVDRRFQHKGTRDGVEVYDDYGHHPTEVKAVLAAFREKFPKQRLVTVFQPHRYSRTLLCWDQFKTCFEVCDQLHLCEIYPAGENPIAGITSERLLREIQASGHAPQSSDQWPSSTDRVARLRNELKPGDVLITLGAGDIWKTGMAFLDDGGH